MSGLETAGGVLALVELSAKVASLCVQYSVDVKHARNDIIRLRTQVNDLETASANIVQLLDGPHSRSLKASQPLRRAIDDGLSELQRLYDSLRPKTARQALSRLGFRSLKWPLQTKEVEKIRQSLRQSTQSMCLALQIDQTSILLNIDQRTVLDRLPVVEGAYFDSSSQEHNRTCLPNTRVELLRQITEWAKDAKTESVFWLNGMAGTGKSTISRTVAQTLANDGYLGASFFFKRGEADRGSISKFFTTIAADLVVRKPEIAPEMKQILENDPSTTTKNAREQFDRLFIQPLSSASLNSDTVVIVVDALDECDREDDVKLMIRLFSGVHIQSPTRIKVFLTSRPELPSRVGFQSMDGNHQDALLHAVPIPVVQRDISFFLEYELTKIRDEYNISVADSLKFSSDWPSDADIRALVSMAVPLFIFAATVCRFIADRKYGNPGKQLTRVLSYQSKSHIAALNETYLLVLNRQLADLNAEEKKETIQEFCDIVGPIVILESPLSAVSLAKILDIPERTIADRLDLLHSVLSVPQSTDSPVRLLHLSFRDFLLDTANASNNDFWIDEKKAHVKMAANCLRLLKCLKEDICDVKEPGTPRATISATTASSCLPSEVRYACLYWIYHVEKADMSISDGDEIHSFLTRDFLHWIEGLALMGRAYESLGLVRNLRSLLKPEDCATTAAFLDDALLFLGAYISTIDSTPLQLYSSLLMFAPRKSIIRNCFKSKVKGLSLWPIVDEDWTQCIQTFEGHAAWLQAVAFSHDSKLLASASGDTDVRIWHTDTGKCAYVLNHHGEVNSVAFSHDSTLLASCDISVRIWRTDTGECIRVLDGHRSFVTCVEFSHDSTLLASASSDKTITIWQSITGEVIRVLEGHADIVSSVTFSHDSKLLASASHDKSVQIWSADTGEQVRVLQGHGRCVSSVAFSPNSKLLASASQDKTIRLWDVESGRHLRVLEGHTADVNSVAFSHDSALLASASTDNTLRIWSTETGYAQTILSYNSGLKSIAFSHDSAHIASASYDKTARIWKVSTSEGSHVPLVGSHENSVSCLATSHDASLLASGSDDSTVRIWSAITGEYIRTLHGHMDMIETVTFSEDSELVFGSVTNKDSQTWCTNTGERVSTPNSETVAISGGNFAEPTAKETYVAGGATSSSYYSWLYLDGCFDFSTDKRWITRNGADWVWLPAEYRPQCAITSPRAVVIGAGSGRVIIIGITAESSGKS